LTLTKVAAARAFAEQGAKVTIFGRDKKTLDAAGVSAFQGDTRRLDDLRRFFAAVGPLDILVASAGIAKFSPLEGLTEALYDEVMDVNVKGTVFTIRQALPHLRDGASVILLGTAGVYALGRPFNATYAMSKASMVALARAISTELLPGRIRVNVLSPGVIDTPIIARGGGLPGVTPEQMAAAITASIPVRRRGTADEMAKALVFLASDDSSDCFGSELVVDGGLSSLVVPA
jgi:NAD(P)-dependent dehydrogenase (short-subunit alcohol dehydrogenase family)